MSDDIKHNSEWDPLVSGKNLVAADFWAHWCPYCSAFKPVFEAVAPEYPEIRFVKVNIDELPDIASRYGIQGIPVVKFFCKGKEVGELAEYTPKERFITEIEKISKDTPLCLASLSSVQPSKNTASTIREK